MLTRLPSIWLEKCWIGSGCRELILKKKQLPLTELDYASMLSRVNAMILNEVASLLELYCEALDASVHDSSTSVPTLSQGIAFHESDGALTPAKPSY